MIQAYNHFLADYSSRITARSSAHKQKELREIYNKIRSMNRNAAYYKLDVSDDKQLFTLSVKDAALALSSTLKELSETFQKPAVTCGVHSSNPDIASASLTDQKNEHFSKSYDIQVHQLAQAQINSGRMISQNAKGPSPASYYFSIRTAEGSYEFSYKVGASSDNRELMKKLADFINKSDIRITASVEEDKAAAASRIILTSLDTGVLEDRELAFEIMDSVKASSETSGLVSYFGLDHVEQTPANAHFIINGTEKTSTRNTFILDRAVSVTLRRASDASVHISPATAWENVSDDLTEFFDTYNNMIRLSQNGLLGNRRSARLQYELNHIVGSDLELLHAAGIRRNIDLTLSLTEGTLKNPEAMNHMKELFEEPDGILAQLTRKMQDIALNPMEYVDKVIITYPNTSRAGFSNPYITSIYSGMFFNSYC